MTGPAAELKEYWIGIGDIHEDVSMLARIPGLSGARGVIVSGDLTTAGGVARARRVLEALRACNPVVYAQIGNMDTAEVTGYLEGEGVNIHRRALRLAEAGESPDGRLPEIGMMGLGYSSPTPFKTPSEAPDAVLGAWLDETWREAKAFERLLLVSHDPPFGTEADMIGKGAHVGSEAVRNFVEKVQPDVCLTGHIHESRVCTRLGRTVLVNPGPLASGGYALLWREADGLKASLEKM